MGALSVDRERDRPQRMVLFHPVTLALVAVAASLLYGLMIAQSISSILFLGAPVAVVMAFLVLLRPDLVGVVLVGLLWGMVTDVAVKYHGIPSITKPLFVLLAGTLVMRRFTMPGMRFAYDRTNWWMLGYLFVLIIGIGPARHPDEALALTIDFGKDVLLYLLIINLIVSARLFRYTIWVLFLMGALLGTLTVYQEATGSYDNDFGGFAQAKAEAQIIEEMEDRPRASGSVGDPNYYGQQLLVLIPLALWAMIRSRSFGQRLVATYAFLALLAGTALTFSRGAYVALAGVLVLFALRFKLKAQTMLVGLILLVGLYTVAPIEIKARVGSLETVLEQGDEAINSERSLRRRLVQMQMAVNMFADHPVLGVGGWNYPYYYPEYIRDHGSHVPDEQRSPHSLYLEVAAEHGLVGLILFSGILLLTWNRLRVAERLFRRQGNRRMADLALALHTAYIGYLASAIWLHGAYPRFLWLQVSLAVALSLIASGRAAVLSPNVVRPAGRPSPGPMADLEKS